MGCVGRAIGFVLLVTVVGTVAMIVWWKSGDQSGMLSHAQLQALRLSGTWRNKDGATITFTSQPTAADGAQGSATFSNVLHFFTYGQGTPPMSGTGHWQLGKVWYGPTGVLISFKDSASQQNSPTSVVLLAEGDPTSPTLVCDSRKSTPACDFTKVS